MQFPIHSIPANTFPLLNEIPEPPRQLNYRGTLPLAHLKLLAVVGSRQYTSYGKQVVQSLISGLRGYPIGIVSGLALGIDSLAHKAALDAGLYTLAIPGSGLDDHVLYPRSHVQLAHTILAHNGGLLSEFDPTFSATKWSFAQRNRIMAGITAATLIIEATEKSGTLITARLASDYNRELLVVPGTIFSSHTKGPHQFLKLGATPVTEASDILYTLGIQPYTTMDTVTVHSDIPKDMQEVLQELSEPIAKDILIRKLTIPITDAHALLMQMEMQGLIQEQHGTIYKLH